MDVQLVRLKMLTTFYSFSDLVCWGVEALRGTEKTQQAG